MAPRFGEQAIDLAQHRARLLGDVGILVFGDLTREVNEPAARRGLIDDEVGEPLADVPAFDGHSVMLPERFKR